MKIIQEDLNDKKEVNNNGSILLLWLSKYNYQGILSLPATMIIYGLLINLWEGCNQGKGYLCYTKPIINDTFKNWQTNLHLQLLNEMIFNSIIGSHVIKNS